MRSSALRRSMRHRMRSPPMRRLRRRLLRRLQLRLLLVVGSLPALLGLSLLLLPGQHVVTARFEQVRPGQTCLMCSAAKGVRGAALRTAARLVVSKSIESEFAGARVRPWRSATSRSHGSRELGAANAGAQVLAA